MNTSNLLSGLLGALIGAGATFLSVWFQLNKQAKLATRERHIVHVDSAITAVCSIMHRIPALPDMNNFAFGYKNATEAEARRASLRAECAALKSFTYLLPPKVGVHWDEWLLCLSDFSTPRTWSDVQLNRAQTDVDAFTRFILSVLDAFKTNSQIPAALERPYLLRESVETWSPSQSKVLTRKRTP
jgi:hypothetical protein